MADIFITTFKRKNYDADSNNTDTGKKTNKKTSKKVEQPPVDLIIKNNESGKKEPERGLVVGSVEKLAERLVENQKKILKLIQNDPHISKEKMAEIIGISTTAVDKNIETLKKQGILKRVGPDKGGHWEIMNGKLETSLS